MSFQEWALFIGGMAATFVIYPRFHMLLGIPYFFVTQFFVPPYIRAFLWHIVGTLLMQTVILFFIALVDGGIAVRISLMLLGYVGWLFFMGQCYSEIHRTSDIALSSETMWQIAWGKLTALSVSALTFPLLCVLMFTLPQAILNPVTGTVAGLLYGLLMIKVVGFVVTIGVCLLWLSILVEGLLAVPIIPYNVLIGLRPQLTLPWSGFEHSPSPPPTTLVVEEQENTCSASEEQELIVK
ncbi:MAG: hypothetical protein GTO51_00630 [Candidatus Latescibacteria bacterium]|nr:hypothetical protein [Candidatus Latescibacterota bacterium]NIM64487.1 hypothetical protein [Candidatus Latescibacterota bacterium]NIO00640.1 hypothetical protein [Candidatus Latescibacterota bacterium]NIO27043.1 hypothetical protein [Candidatus Latescibacterota bacterium]NIO54567.1 hypothetical protein [Candidatus Latescibacterota bacterium]